MNATLLSSSVDKSTDGASTAFSYPTDIKYLDEDLLVIQQNRAGGVDGGIFIQVKVDSASEPVPF
jgi:hypothetical protein